MPPFVQLPATESKDSFTLSLPLSDGASHTWILFGCTQGQSFNCLPFSFISLQNLSLSAVTALLSILLLDFLPQQALIADTFTRFTLISAIQ